MCEDKQMGTPRVVGSGVGINVAIEWVTRGRWHRLPGKEPSSDRRRLCACRNDTADAQV